MSDLLPPEMIETDVSEGDGDFKYDLIARLKNGQVQYLARFGDVEDFVAVSREDFNTLQTLDMTRETVNALNSEFGTSVGQALTDIAAELRELRSHFMGEEP